MPDQSRLKQLAALFRETGSAHHRAFSETDGEDSEWPLWYADYLKERLPKVLMTDLTKSEVVHLIMLAERERQQRTTAAPWPDYYARFFLERYG